jgi:hypothetical protein
VLPLHEPAQPDASQNHHNLRELAQGILLSDSGSVHNSQAHICMKCIIDLGTRIAQSV